MRAWLRTPVMAISGTFLDNMCDIVFPEERGEFNSNRTVKITKTKEIEGRKRGSGRLYAVTHG
jgi:hypothetical protein